MKEKSNNTQQNFFMAAIGFFILVLVIAYVPQLFQNESSKKSTDPIAEASPTPLVGVIVEGENMGQEVDMSDAVLAQEITEGTGAEVKSGDRISIHYHGTLQDGTVFDSSVDRNEPFEATIGVGELIKGWDVGVPGMKVGGKRLLTIPPNMGYGDRETGKIPANSTLIFEVEVLDIID